VSTPDTPDIAVITSVQTPYRLHLHERIAREMPEVRLWSLYTHDQADQPWELGQSESIRPVRFARGEGVVGSSHPRHTFREWRKAGRVIGWLMQHNIKAVLACGYNDAGRLRIIRWCRRAGIPCFLVADSNSRSDHASGLKFIAKRLVVRLVVRSVTGIMPCGTLGAEFFRRYGARSDRMFFVPYEPDYEMIRRLPGGAIEREVSRFGLAPQRRRLVFCGRLAEVKRVDLAIDAFCRISGERPDWDLVIIGDGPLRDRLGARVPAVLTGRVIWTGFIGEQERISAIYRACHAMVLPSDFEPWAVVINEAGAAGLAIVASDVVGAAAELVRDGVNGRIFRVGDLSHLTECLLEVTDSSRIESLRAASPGVLEDWRRWADPVDGIRRALAMVGVLPAAPAADLAPSAEASPDPETAGPLG
jgi:glycosyltransferase involved in cell wall biosynthesis